MKRLEFICDCGCRVQLLIQKLDNGELMIDTRINGRHRWIGVVLHSGAKEQLKGFFSQ